MSTAPTATATGTILVVGQIARDLILSVDEVLTSGSSARVRDRLEQLGGKGANQAVGMAQLGAEVALLGVVGADDVGTRLLRAARQDGLGTGAVVSRGRSALLLDVVDDEHGPRLLEDIPPESTLTGEDVRHARDAILGAATVCLQLQQPAAALLATARLAAEAETALVLDGSVEESVMAELIPHACVLRADAHEARLLTGVGMDDEAAAVRAAQDYLDRGLDVVAFGVESAGDVVAWDGGHRFYPFAESSTVDTTGAGDAFLAGLVVGLRAGHDPGWAGELAARCAAATVQRLGGRPDLTGFRPD